MNIATLNVNMNIDEHARVRGCSCMHARRFAEYERFRMHLLPVARKICCPKLGLAGTEFRPVKATAGVEGGHEHEPNVCLAVKSV